MYLEEVPGKEPTKGVTFRNFDGKKRPFVDFYFLSAEHNEKSSDQISKIRRERGKVSWEEALSKCRAEFKKKFNNPLVETK